jgi:hypothetical protein
MSFVWDENCENAFQTIKEQLMSSPVLAFPEPNGDYILYTDASDVGVGAVLVQEDGEGEERVISYASKLPQRLPQRKKHTLLFGLCNISIPMCTDERWSYILYRSQGSKVVEKR